MKYKDDEVYGKGIRVVLSEEGVKWMEEFFKQVDRALPEGHGSQK